VYVSYVFTNFVQSYFIPVNNYRIMLKVRQETRTQVFVWCQLYSRHFRYKRHISKRNLRFEFVLGRDRQSQLYFRQ